MERTKPNNQTKSSKEGYIIMPNNFLAEWIRVMGKGPVLLYIQLLTYCHKEKDIAWPALSTLGDSLNMSKNSLISYQKTLLEYGLIKKTAGRKTAQGNYRSNLYKVTPIRSPKNGPGRVQKLDTGSPKIALDQVQNLHPNNTNLNNTNLTATTKREKDAVAAVNFKKLKEEGKEKMRAPYNSKEHYTGQAPYSSKEKEHYTGQAIRERMAELDFKEGFVEKMLKEYSLKKIEEKLDLLMERKNIQSPAGWLMAALQNDYRGEEPVEESEDFKCRGLMNPTRQESAERMNPPPTKTKTNSENNKILSTEEARRRFHSLREQLMAMK